MKKHNFNDHLTITQEKVLVWTTRCSGLVSVVGSIFIIRMILQTRYRRESARNRKPLKVRQRLMLWMSFFDILASISNSFSTAALPRIKETEDIQNIYGTIGNESTCIAQGFFLQLGIAVPMYNAALCLYYLFIIRYNMNERWLRGVFERIVHVIVITCALTTAIISVTLDLIHDTGLFCWLAEYPLNCRLEPDINCMNNYNHTIIFFFGVFPVCLSFLIVAVAMILVYLSIHNNYITMRKYSFGGVHSQGVINLLREKKQTAAQATLFVLAFILTWIMPLINIILITSYKPVPFSAAIMQGFLMPLQGFWNAVIYARPSFVKLRKENPDRKLFWILKAIIFPTVES